MAPEIILGMEYDETVDIFSYGVCLCELTIRMASGLGENEFSFKRNIPGFGIDANEVIEKQAGVMCNEFLNLALICANEDKISRLSWDSIQNILFKLVEAHEGI